MAEITVRGPDEVAERLAAPPAQAGERRWMDSFYLDEPTSLDDPYRYERW